jgi:hypothetical protein
MVEVFDQVAVPVAEELTRGAFLGPWRLMSIDGIEWDAPDTPENVAAFGYPGSTDNPSAFPKVRVVTVAECASHAVVAAVIGAQRQAEQTLAATTIGDLAAAPAQVLAQTYHDRWEHDTSQTGDVQVYDRRSR